MRLEHPRNHRPGASVGWLYVLEIDRYRIAEPAAPKARDVFDKSTADQITALCIDRHRLGSFVPPMLSGEATHLTMLRVVLPEDVYVGTSLFASGREAARELVAADPNAPFDWVIRDGSFLSFHDPRKNALKEIVEGSVEIVETAAVAFPDEIDDEHVFIDLLNRTLSAQLDSELTFDRETPALYFRAPAENYGRTYQSLVNEASSEVVKPWRGRNGHVGSVRHHTFVPRFQRIGEECYLSVTPTFFFTRDGFRPHYNAGALIAGKKKKEKNGAVRGQFIMWRHLLIASGTQRADLLTSTPETAGPLRFETLEPIIMPVAVPEEAWRREDPNVVAKVEVEGFL